MSSAVTALSKFGIGATSTVDLLVNHQEFTLGIVTELRDTNATRGTFFKDTNLVRGGPIRVAPSFRCQPTPTELATFLEWVMGGSPTGSGTVTYPWSNTPLTKFAHYAPVAGKQYLMSGVGVDTFTLSGQQNEPMGCSFGLLGQTYDDTVNSFPAIAPDQAKSHLLLSDLTLLVGGATKLTREFSFEVMNHLDRDRMLNSNSLTRVQKLGAQFRFSIDVPSGDYDALYSQGIAGVTLSATFTNAGTGASLVVTSPALHFPAQTPAFSPGGEGFLKIESEAYRTSGTASPVTVTLNVGS